MQILPSEVSIVFQGSIGRLGSPERAAVHRAVASAQAFYPGCEVILATWKGTVDEAIPGAIVVECEDPGAIRCAGDEIINLNRQLVSSREGVAASTRAYVVKMRTDTYFTHGKLFDYFAKLPRPSNGLSRERIAVVNLTFRNPHRVQPYPFCVCDWLYAGTREDLVELFAVPNYPPEYVHWFTSESKPANDPWTAARCRYYAETYIWYNFVRRTFALAMEHSSDNRPALVETSERVAADNLIVLTYRMAGLGSSKHVIPFAYHEANYTYKEWLSLLNHYQVRHTLPTPWLDWEKLASWYATRLRPALSRLLGQLGRPYRKLRRLLTR